jgi:surface protein
MSDEEKANAKKLIKVTQWGDISWETFNNVFAHAINLDVNATDTPASSKVRKMGSMFLSTSNLTGNKYFNDWDVSSVENMQTIFQNSTFNAPINDWDVSKVTYMGGMFYQARIFNQDIANWDTGKVTNVYAMLYGTSAFTNHDLSGWDVRKVTSHGAFNNGSGSGNTWPNFP